MRKRDEAPPRSLFSSTQRPSKFGASVRCCAETLFQSTRPTCAGVTASSAASLSAVAVSCLSCSTRVEVLRRKVAAPEGAPTGSGLLRILVEKRGKCPVRTSSSTIYIGFCAHNTCAKRSLIARPFWASSASAARPFAHVRLSILVLCVRLSSDRNAASSTSSLTVYSVIFLGRVVTCESMMRVSDVCVGVSVGVWTACVPRCAPGC